MENLGQHQENLQGKNKKTMQPTPEYGPYNPQEYLAYLGLTRNPFPVAPDNTDFYISQHNDTIIKKLTQAVFSRKGFMLLTGEIGLGKTTICRRIIEILEQSQVETSLVLQSFYQEASLLKEIIKDFGICVEEVRNDISTLMKLLNDFLLKQNEQGINCAILIDDAQNLTIESLELIRMISNLEADREKLVQIILVGQPELLHKLNSNELRQLKSRVTINQTHVPLEKTEMAKYIQFKLNRAGDPGKILINDAVIKKIYQLTKGNLRNVNILLDHALQYAYEDRTHTLCVAYIKKAYKELLLENKDLQKNSLSSWIILTLVFIIVGLIGGGALFYYQSANELPHPAPLADKPDKPIPMPSKQDATSPSPAKRTMASPDIKTPVNQAVVEKPVPKKEEPIQSEPDVSGSVLSFLSVYGLESFSSDFQTALLQKHFTPVVQSIFDKTGYQLIVLNSLSPDIQGKYDILSYKNSKTNQTEYYLFWKPWLKIVKFYSGYRGEEISDLQTLLARTDLYDYNIDGIVGQIIMKSVKEFQRGQGLPVSGFPNPETIFLLAHSTPTP